MYVIHKFLDSVVCKANSDVSCKSCCIYIHGLIKSHAPYIISIPQYILYIVLRRYFIWRGRILNLQSLDASRKKCICLRYKIRKINYIDNLFCFIGLYMSVKTNNLYELYNNVFAF